MSNTPKAVKTKLFIGNLDPATQQSELNDLFAPFGNVLEASVIKDYGFVHYGTIEEAEKAAAALHNKEFHGKRLRVEVSTSTVRHRPGQPEPASALRNSTRSRTAMSGATGSNRYHSGGVGGPIRHNSSSWARHESRPYDPVGLDPSSYHSGYGPMRDSGNHYDRSRPDARNYYDDRGDNNYGAPPSYNNNGGQMDMYPMRDYRDDGGHHRGGNMNYGSRGMYDRPAGTSPIDPYYAGGISRAPPNPNDSYSNYDSYQKYYSDRPRDPDYPTATNFNGSSRDYDPYSNYNSDPYAMSANPSSVRNDVSATYQQSKSGYRASRQQSSYGHGASYSSSHAQYYGAQQRA